MTTERYILWIGVTLLWFAAISAAQYPLRKRCGIPIRIILSIAKLLTGIFIAYLFIAVDAPFVYTTGYVFVPLHIVLLADTVGDILTLPMIIKKRKERPYHNRVQITICAVCTLIYLTFGTVNMQIVSADRFTVVSDKLRQDHRFVFVADLHVGSSQSMQTVKNTIRKIDEENADFVLLGGDIVDEYTTKEEMKQTFELLGSIKAPVYFIYGNHDTQPSGDLVGGPFYTQDELESAITSNGISILKDQLVSISDDLVVLGREDITMDERKPVSELPLRPDNVFVLSVDHSPYNTEDIIETGADLQLSGHTHAGQLFPLQIFYSSAGYDVYGFYQHGNTDVYVSSGVSGWCYPFRTEAGCQYQVISLEAKG